MREVERQVMLRIIDQRWREHLEEMDYLQEGINLRAMGQKDPLVEWQREGYEMFGAMMKGIAQDFVQVRHARPGRPAPGQAPADAPVVQNVQTIVRATTCMPAASTAAARAAVAEGELPAEALPPQPQTGEAADDRQGRVVEDPAQRAVPVRVGQEVQACATARPERRGRGAHRSCVTSPTTSATCVAALDEAASYLKIDDNRDRLVELEAEVGRPDLWDDQERAKKLNTEYANVKTTSTTFDDLAGELDDAEVLHELAREVDDESQEPEIDDAIAVDHASSSTSSTCAACSPASTTRPTASCRSTPRTAASTPRTSPRCCCGCTSAGPSAAASTSSSTT